MATEEKHEDDEVKLDRYDDAVAEGEGFCADVRRIMFKYGMEEQFTSDPGDDNVAVWRWWDGIDYEDRESGQKVHIVGVGDWVRYKQQQWWHERLRTKKKGSTYLSYKRQTGAESYLMNGEGNRSGRVWKTRMRACAAPLQAELVREHRESSPVCKLCGAAVEDQTHMLVNCVAYERARGRMYAQVRKAVGDRVWNEYANNGVGLGCWLLRDEDCDLPSNNFLHAWSIRMIV